MKGTGSKGMEPEEKHMREAIRQTEKTGKLGEVSIDCVIIYQNKIIGRGYNRRIIDKNVLSHTETIVIKKACKVMGDWWLEDCTIYVTLGPCPICVGAIVQTRIPRVVIDYMNSKAGCAGSVPDMLHRDGLNHQVETSIGMMEERYSIILKELSGELRHSKP